MSLHSTLASYLEKLLWLLTGRPTRSVLDMANVLLARLRQFVPSSDAET